MDEHFSILDAMRSACSKFGSRVLMNFSVWFGARGTWAYEQLIESGGFDCGTFSVNMQDRSAAFCHGDIAIDFPAHCVPVIICVQDKCLVFAFDPRTQDWELKAGPHVVN